MNSSKKIDRNRKKNIEKNLHNLEKNFIVSKPQEWENLKALKDDKKALALRVIELEQLLNDAVDEIIELKRKCKTPSTNSKRAR